MTLEHAAVDGHGRMEERGREECRPPDRTSSDGHPVHRPERPVCMQVDRCGSHDRCCRGRPEPPEDALEPAGERDVVGIDPRDVRAAGRIEADVQRAGEPERHCVPHDPHAVVADARENLSGAIDRAVVDCDELQVVERLTDDAPDRLSDGRLRVASGEDD
jgi:hypothetical protein